MDYFFPVLILIVVGIVFASVGKRTSDHIKESGYAIGGFGAGEICIGIGYDLNGWFHPGIIALPVAALFYVVGKVWEKTRERDTRSEFSLTF